jgi:hypothetical protein
MASVNYIESDVPGDLTLIEWRRAHTPDARPRRRLRTLLLRSIPAR